MPHVKLLSSLNKTWVDLLDYGCCDLGVTDLVYKIIIVLYLIHSILLVTGLLRNNDWPHVDFLSSQIKVRSDHCISSLYFFSGGTKYVILTWNRMIENQSP